MKTLAGMMPTNPTASVFLSNFSGTLQELLERVKKNHLFIIEILLNELSRQILLFCQNKESLECKADSVAITAQLVLLKTKELLIKREEIEPQLQKQEAKPSLIKELIQLLDQKERLSLRKLARKFPLPEKIKEMPLSMSLLDLKSMFAKFIKQTKNEPMLSLKKERWSLPEIMRNLHNVLEKKELDFYEIFFPIKNKSLLIFTFLALLELIKQQKVSLQVKENTLYFKAIT